MSANGALPTTPNNPHDAGFSFDIDMTLRSPLPATTTAAQCNKPSLFPPPIIAVAAARTAPSCAAVVLPTPPQQQQQRNPGCSSVPSVIFAEMSPYDVILHQASEWKRDLEAVRQDMYLLQAQNGILLDHLAMATTNEME